MEKFAYKLLTASKVNLKTYMGEALEVLGEIQCSIACKGKRYNPLILVGDYDRKLTLLRKNWLWIIMLEWGEICCFPKGDPVSSDSHLNDLLSKL